MYDAARNLCRVARGNGLATSWSGVPALGAVLATGPEATSFLQAQLTNNIKALEPGHGQLSCRLDRRGNLLHWFHLLRLPDRGQPFPSYLLVLPATEIADLLEDLHRFIFSEKITLENVSQDFEGLLLQGSDSEALLKESMASVEGPHRNLVWPLSLTGDPGLLVLTQGTGKLDPLLSRIRQVAANRGWITRDDEPGLNLAWSWLQVEAGLPHLGIDLESGSRVLPQTGLEHSAVSYDKGCYLGQEVVARIRTYGSVPQAMRALVFLEADISLLDSLPEPEDDLTMVSGQVVGTWASKAWSETWQAPVALVFLGREQRSPGQDLLLNLPDGSSVQAQVQLLPLFSGGDTKERARDLHSRAVRLFSNHEDDQAVALLEEALRMDPGLSDAYEALGVILGRQERFPEAIAIFKQLEEVAPDEPMVHTNLSLFYMKIGDREEAERQKALGTMKRFGNLGSVAETEGPARAERQARQEDAERKLTMFAEVLALDPEDGLALMGTGNALVELGRLDEAALHLERAQAGQKDNSALYLARAKVLQDLNRRDEAATILARGIKVASKRGDLQPLREMEQRLALLQAQVGS